MLQTNVALDENNCGNVAGAVKYLLQAKDHKGRIRAGIDILLGDANQLIAVCNSMKSKHKYHSSVLAFTANDAAKLNDDQLGKILESYLALLACALAETSRLSAFAVRHTQEDGGFHVHVVVAKHDLRTAKHYDPFVSMRGDIDRFHQWVQIINHDYCLDDPNAIGHQREFGYSKRLPATSKGALESINAFVSSGVRDGSFSSRRDVISALSQIEGVTIAKVGKQYISVKVDGFKRNLRLKGRYYEQSFSSIGSLAKEAEGIASQDIEAIRLEFQQRSETLKSRYGHRFNQSDTSNHNSVVDILDYELLRDLDGIVADTSKRIDSRNANQRKHRIIPVASKSSLSCPRKHRRVASLRRSQDTDSEQRINYARMQNTLEALTLIAGTYRWNVSSGKSWAVREVHDGSLHIQGSESSWRAAAAIAHSKEWEDVIVQVPSNEDATLAIRELLKAGLSVNVLIVAGKPIVGPELQMMLATAQSKPTHHLIDRISFA